MKNKLRIEFRGKKDKIWTLFEHWCSSRAARLSGYKKSKKCQSLGPTRPHEICWRKESVVGAQPNAWSNTRSRSSRPLVQKLLSNFLNHARPNYILKLARVANLLGLVRAKPVRKNPFWHRNMCPSTPNGINTTIFFYFEEEQHFRNDTKTFQYSSISKLEQHPSCLHRFHL